LRPILWATGTLPVEALQAGGFVPLPRSNAGQSDAGLVQPARLGSPLALQRRAHPGDSGWIPARFGRLVHPRLYFRNCAFSQAPTFSERWLPRLTPEGLIWHAQRRSITTG